MTAHLAYIGLGANVGDSIANVRQGLQALKALGRIVRRSSFYRTQPWGKNDQPPFVNAVALLETFLEPRPLLDALKAAEIRLGRVPGVRWGPRALDLDLLLYDEREIHETGLHVPHRHLFERAFVLVPLAQIAPRFVRSRDALDADDLTGVVPLDEHAARAIPRRREGGGMSPEQPQSVAERIRALAAFFGEGDAVRVSVEDAGGRFELSRSAAAASALQASDTSAERPAPRRDTISADLVGIFHLSRPVVAEGEAFEGDRELGYVEALGIRTPVHSMGGGRVATVNAADGTPVEYGQALFVIERG